MSSPERLPRVTEILRATGLAPDFSAIPEAVLEAARQRGTARHEAIEADHYGLVEPEQEPLLGGYRRFLADTGHVPMVSELRFEERTWGYRTEGIDRIGRHGDERWLIEWKPMGTNLYAASLQLAAYRHGLELHRIGLTMHRGVVVELTDDTYRMTDVTKPDPGGRWPGLDAAWTVFQGALVVYRAQQEMRR